jgi:hypothetical protein
VFQIGDLARTERAGRHVAQYQEQFYRFSPPLGGVKRGRQSGMEK